MFANERRGLCISDSNFRYLTEGAYSVIFKDQDAGRALKLFKSSHPIIQSARVFAAEVEAHKIAAGTAELKDLVPEFFCTPTALRVEDKDGRDVTTEFHPDLAIEMEFLPVHFADILIASRNEQERIRNLFQSHDIQHMSDVSVALNEHGQIVKVVDFAVKEIVPEADPL
jgi:hypothetical protein